MLYIGNYTTVWPGLSIIGYTNYMYIHTGRSVPQPCEVHGTVHIEHGF